MRDWLAIATFLDHWQSLIAGLAGASAAIAAILFTLRAERRRRDQEAEAITIAPVQKFGNSRSELMRLA